MTFHEFKENMNTEDPFGFYGSEAENAWNSAVQSCILVLYDPDVLKWEYVAGVAWQSDGYQVLDAERTLEAIEAAMHALIDKKKEMRAIEE